MQTIGAVAPAVLAVLGIGLASPCGDAGATPQVPSAAWISLVARQPALWMRDVDSRFFQLREKEQIHAAICTSQRIAWWLTAGAVSGCLLGLTVGCEEKGHGAVDGCLDLLLGLLGGGSAAFAAAYLAEQIAFGRMGQPGYALQNAAGVCGGHFVLEQHWDSTRLWLPPGVAGGSFATASRLYPATERDAAFADRTTQRGARWAESGAAAESARMSCPGAIVIQLVRLLSLPVSRQRFDKIVPGRGFMDLWIGRT